MSRRIDIELTSTRDDGTWTWRAAGARQPKGALDGGLLPPDSTVGQVLRAEVETSIDGTEVISVTPPKEKKSDDEGRIELISRDLRDDELVIETRARRGRRDRDDRRGGRGGDRRRRRDGDRDDRRGPDGRGRDGRGRGGRGRDDDRGDRRDGPRRDRSDRPRRERSQPLRPKAKRLRPARTHRKAALDALEQNERVVAEQVLQGGIPAVRQGVEKMNEAAKAEGRPEIKPDALLQLAERLLPALRTAEWRDRAEAAIADLDELDLRDLRSVVVASDQAARDDETRAMAATIREGLDRRVEAEQASWLADMAETLADGRVVRALRLSSRPPKAGAPLPADLANRLAEATSAGLTADTHPDRWLTVLDALSYSPVRLTVAPESKPEEPSEELIAGITRFASRVPKVAEAFGIEAPPETGRRRGRGSRRGRRGGEGKAARATDTSQKANSPADRSSASTENAGSPSEKTPSAESVKSTDASATAESTTIEQPAATAEPTASEAPTDAASSSTETATVTEATTDSSEQVTAETTASEPAGATPEDPSTTKGSGESSTESPDAPASPAEEASITEESVDPSPAARGSETSETVAAAEAPASDEPTES